MSIPTDKSNDFINFINTQLEDNNLNNNNSSEDKISTINKKITALQNNIESSISPYFTKEFKKEIKQLNIKKNQLLNLDKDKKIVKNNEITKDNNLNNTNSSEDKISIIDKKITVLQNNIESSISPHFSKGFKKEIKQLNIENNKLLMNIENNKLVSLDKDSQIAELVKNNEELDKKIVHLKKKNLELDTEIAKVVKNNQELDKKSTN